MRYNPTYQINKQEEHTNKTELSSPVNGVTPQKKKLKKDDFPTPPPSGGYSAAAAKMMVRQLDIFIRREKFKKLIIYLGKNGL